MAGAEVAMAVQQQHPLELEVERQAAELKKDPLTVPDLAEVKKELGLDAASPQVMKPEVDAKIRALAEENCKKLFAIDLQDDKTVASNRADLESFGLNVQKESAECSKLLEEPIGRLASMSEDGGSVAKDLIQLNMKVEKLGPNKFDFSPGWFARATGLFSNRLKKWVLQYNSSKTVINALVGTLDAGMKEIERDCRILTDDQTRMRVLTRKLERLISLGQLMIEQIEAKCAGLKPDDPQLRFYQEEFLYPLNLQVQDLATSRGMNQNGVLAVEMLVRTNKLLIRGIRRAKTITIPALRIAVMVATALAHQKRQIDVLNALSETTDNMILRTSEQLLQQGVEIQKQAAAPILKVDTLKRAFANINLANEQLATYRRDALPQMGKIILELNDLSGQAEESIVKMVDKGHVAQSKIEESLDKMFGEAA